MYLISPCFVVSRCFNVHTFLVRFPVAQGTLFIRVEGTPLPEFLFVKSSAITVQIIFKLGKFSEYGVITFQPIREVT